MRVNQLIARLIEVRDEGHGETTVHFDIDGSLTRRIMRVDVEQEEGGIVLLNDRSRAN